jgi:hypothetical protein
MLTFDRESLLGPIVILSDESKISSVTMLCVPVEVFWRWFSTKSLQPMPSAEC